MSEPSEEVTSLEAKCHDALFNALGNGTWIDSRLEVYVFEMAVSAQKKYDAIAAEESQQSQDKATLDNDIDESGWISDSWAAWRLILRSGDNPAITYFSREPTPAEIRAFAKAANTPISDALVEGRPQ